MRSKAKSIAQEEWDFSDFCEKQSEQVEFCRRYEFARRDEALKSEITDRRSRDDWNSGLGITLKLARFETTDAWRQYSWEQFQMVEKIEAEVGLKHCLHLWPDKDMPTKKYFQSLPNPTGFVDWLTKWWTRISEWPE